MLQANKNSHIVLPMICVISARPKTTNYADFFVGLKF